MMLSGAAIAQIIRILPIHDTDTDNCGGTRVQVIAKAMGGIAYGLRDKYQVNFANPASYTAIDSLTFIFDGGISLQNTNFSNGTIKQNAKTPVLTILQCNFVWVNGLL